MKKLIVVWFLSLGKVEEDAETQAIRALTLGFELPRNFLNPEKFRPDQIPEDRFAGVPDVITDTLFSAMDATVPIDAFNPFIYVRNGILPELVVAYFMQMVGRRVKSTMSKFFQAMHLIEMYREYVIIPPEHFMASLDTAAAVIKPVAEEAKSDETVQEDNDEKKVPKGKDDAAPSNSDV